MQGKGRSPLLLMALTVFIDIAGFGLILPLLPFWAEKLGANPAQVGLILTVYALAQFLFTPVLGALSDRFGRKPIIIVSLLIEALSFALTALAGSLWLLLLARFIGGMGASNIGTAQAVVADTTTAESRARGMGLIGASIGLGFVIGPAVGGVLAGAERRAALLGGDGRGVGERGPGAGAAAGDTQGAGSGETSPAGVQRESALAGWARILRNPAVARLALINFIFTLAFTAMEAVYPLFSQKVFGWKALENGYIFTYVGVIIVLMQGGMVAQIVKRIGERATMILGLALLAVRPVPVALQHDAGNHVAGAGAAERGRRSRQPDLFGAALLRRPRGCPGRDARRGAGHRRARPRDRPAAGGRAVRLQPRHRLALRSGWRPVSAGPADRAAPPARLACPQDRACG